METFIEATGYFLYPLGICSVLAVAIILDRLIGLRKNHIAPAAIEKTIMQGKEGSIPEAVAVNSVVGRIYQYASSQAPDGESLRAYTNKELVRMQRGLFVLDTVVSIAPVIGLLGTVWGLYRVFNAFDPAQGMPDPVVFVESLGLALSTTMLGLIVALPAMIGNYYLQRRVDRHAADLEVITEQLRQRFCTTENAAASGDQESSAVEA